MGSETGLNELLETSEFHEKYCPEGIDEDAFFEDLEKVFLAREANCGWNSRLKRFFLRDWTDWDDAGWQMGILLGLWKSTTEDPLSYAVKNKYVFWSNNKLGNALSAILDDLVVRGVMKHRLNEDEEHQYRSVGALVPESNKERAERIDVRAKALEEAAARLESVDANFLPPRQAARIVRKLLVRGEDE